MSLIRLAIFTRTLRLSIAPRTPLTKVRFYAAAGYGNNSGKDQVSPRKNAAQSSAKQQPTSSSPDSKARPKPDSKQPAPSAASKASSASRKGENMQSAEENQTHTQRFKTVTQQRQADRN